MVSSPFVKFLPALPVTPLLALLLLPVTAPAAAQVPPGAPPAAEPAGDVLRIPTAVGEEGPLFALAPVVERFGGRLEARRGDSWALFLDDREILLGPEAATLAVDTEIFQLSQAPRVVDGRIFVPLDLLDLTYGRLRSIRFAWDEATDTLSVGRRRPRLLEVSTDVVHLQGVTTVVVELGEQPRYRVAERSGGVDLLLTGDRFADPRRRRVDDPLLDSVVVRRDRVSLDLAPGVGFDTYTLENPFRVVFDLVREAAPREREVDPPVTPERPRDEEGIRTIVLDPGHGGEESGAVGPSGVQEKQLTLLLARALEARLESALGVRVILTRTEDVQLPLETRTAIANQNKADLFVSLHLNSAFGSDARGAETYFLSTTASDERAARAAELENRPAAGGGDGGDDPLHDLQLILWDLAQTHYLEQSQELGTLIQGELNSALSLRDRGVKQAPFVVLMGAAMPAVLVELGFLSNPEEERRLQDPAYRAELTSALVRAIARYKRQVEAGDDGGTSP